MELHDAIKKPLVRVSDIITVGNLIEDGADLDKTDDNDRTPLRIAAYRGQRFIAELLVNAGVDIDKTCKNGMSPLLCAVWIGYEEIAKKLLQHNAAVYIRDTDGCIAYDLTHHRTYDPVMVKLLKNYRRDKNHNTHNKKKWRRKKKNLEQQMANLSLNSNNNQETQ